MAELFAQIADVEEMEAIPETDYYGRLGGGRTLESAVENIADQVKAGIRGGCSIVEIKNLLKKRLDEILCSSSNCWSICRDLGGSLDGFHPSLFFEAASMDELIRGMAAFILQHRVLKEAGA